MQLPAEFVIRLRALPADVPPAVRLRRALKLLLRGFRLKCEAVEEVQGERQAGGARTEPVGILVSRPGRQTGDDSCG